MGKSGHSVNFSLGGDFRHHENNRVSLSYREEIGVVIARENLHCLQGWKAMRLIPMQVGGARSQDPIEIRVTPDEIIEIYNSADSSVTEDDQVSNAANEGSATQCEICEGNGAAHSVMARRRARAARLVGGYIVFVALAAGVIWWVVK